MKLIVFLLKVLHVILKKMAVSFFHLFSVNYLKCYKAMLGKRIRFNGRCVLQLQKGCLIQIGDDFSCNSGVENAVDNTCCSKIVVLRNAKLHIGKMSGMSNTVLQCKNHIEIGDYVNIGAGCFIMDNNFHSLDWRERMNRGDGSLAKYAPVVIKDYAFIGARSIICKGVTIGKRSIVAAGSVIVKDVPDDEMWGGNPAKFIKKV